VQTPERSAWLQTHGAALPAERQDEEWEGGGPGVESEDWDSEEEAAGRRRDSHTRAGQFLASPPPLPPFPTPPCLIVL